MLPTLGGSVCQRLMSRPFWRRRGKTVNLKWLMMMVLLPFDSAPRYARRHTHLFALCLRLNRKDKKKKKPKKTSQVEDVTLGTDGKPGAALSNTNLQEAAGAVHRQRSASTLDSLIQLCDSRVSDTHQSLRLPPISMNVSVRVLC